MPKKCLLRLPLTQVNLHGRAKFFRTSIVRFDRLHPSISFKSPNQGIIGGYFSKEIGRTFNVPMLCLLCFKKLGLSNQHCKKKAYLCFQFEIQQSSSVLFVMPKILILFLTSQLIQTFHLKHP